MKKIFNVLLFLVALPPLAIGVILLGILNALLVGFKPHDYSEWR